MMLNHFYLFSVEYKRGGEDMKRTKRAQFLRYLLVVSALAVLPIVLLFVVNINTVAEFIQNKLRPESYEMFDSLISYLSLAVTVLLGIVVYEQAQKINDLESSQYEVFLGATGLDNDYSLGDVLLMGNNPFDADFQPIQSYDNAGKSFLTNLQTDFGPPEKAILFPLVFVIKSSTLITTMIFQKIIFEISDGGIVLNKKEFTSSAEPIHELFEDNSKFVFAMGTMIPENLKIEEVRITFDVLLCDQICREHQKRIAVKLKKFNDTFYLCSSKSK